ncbi:ATP-binding protein [Fructobacillus tropaeoli]|uniref:ATP-binding protein n=1 Tax=Fructobacillus tropaeoli TaxID=709323 RepID=UPI002DA11150|nr:Superfamily I DNA and/or RNA helicase (DNA2) [Fructobacillus tropaeoli]
MIKNIRNVLKTWILIEHLKEGIIDVDRKEDESFFYHKVSNFEEFREKVDLLINLKGPKSNIEVNVYLDIFNIEPILERLSINKDEVPSISGDSNLKSPKYFKLKLSFTLDKDMNLVLSEKLFLSASGVLYSQYQGGNPFDLNIKQKESEIEKEIARTFDHCQFSEAFNKVIKKFSKTYNNMYFSVVGKYDSDTSLHSFFVNDLNWAQRNTDNKNLEKYLFGRDQNESFVDFNNQKNVKYYTEPVNYPLGRFPSNPAYSLSLMQQVAVNIATKRIDADAVQGVNGPPGTGKTTLLKEIFSDYIVQQAKLIIDLKEQSIQESETDKNSQTKLKSLNKKISDLEIIVASSNNGAVQNIVSELPKLDSIYEDFLPSLLDIDYFTSINEVEIHNEGEVSKWGEFSREAGKTDNLIDLYKVIDKILDSLSSDNRLKKEETYNKFNNLYNELFNQREKLQKDWIKKKELSEEKSQTIIELTEQEAELEKTKNKEKELIFEIHKLERDINSKRLDLWNMQKIIIKIPFLNFLLPKTVNELVRKIKKTKQERFKLGQKVQYVELRIVTLTSKLESLKKDLELLTEISRELKEFDNKLFEGNNNRDNIEIGNPFFNHSFRKKQSELFILALAVRKFFLLEHKKDIRIANNIFHKKYEFKDNPKLLAEAWHWINFTIPIISSTFASFERMFEGFDQKSLGNLFIDEAGQATPQSAVGAILRSKRILAVGDPQQLTPVQQIDQRAMNYLAQLNHASTDFVDLSLSVQDLVDKASIFGMTINDEHIGIPLTVHRRCSSPMFEISNKIAYSGRMVQGKSNSNGKAQWIDVSGKAKDKFVKEQEEETVSLIEKLTKIKHVSGNSIYIISPFKNVVMKLKKNKRITSVVPSKSIGTVHTFQGKENKIVIFVLGADEESKHSADWAFAAANLANVAITRAKEELFVIGDKSLYMKIDNANTMYRMIEEHNNSVN